MVRLCQNHRLQIKIERIAVVAGRQISVHTVFGRICRSASCTNNAAPCRIHAAERFRFAEHDPGDEQRGCFSDQMRVRAAELRRVSMNVLQLREQRVADSLRRGVVEV